MRLLLVNSTANEGDICILLGCRMSSTLGCRILGVRYLRLHFFYLPRLDSHIVLTSCTSKDRSAEHMEIITRDVLDSDRIAAKSVPRVYERGGEGVVGCCRDWSI